MSNASLHNDYLRTLLANPLKELLELENNNELILSFSNGICQLIKENGSATQLLKAVSLYEIKRETDPFCDNSGGMLTYCQDLIFFKISKNNRIDIGLYDEISDMRILRNEYQWFALNAVKDF
tara:strand:- start:30445 stop:30813 length:369 start_codon:yes stop_codon:yes gene_type:complete